MATRNRRPRACTYCLCPDADACVRVQPPAHGGAHVYAHRTCASDRRVPTLYVFTDEPAAGPR
ncbi:hypothetical protein ACIQUL_08980 [Streptomyces sp. NPDC090303]|uniref:hypothetical protein n=1 Tax=Streptomyces sp. NPDC090303 TaxID=3365960 RepID=UPI0038301CB4